MAASTRSTMSPAARATLDRLTALAGLGAEPPPAPALGRALCLLKHARAAVAVSFQKALGPDPDQPYPADDHGQWCYYDWMQDCADSFVQACARARAQLGVDTGAPAQADPALESLLWSGPERAEVSADSFLQELARLAIACEALELTESELTSCRNGRRDDPCARAARFFAEPDRDWHVRDAEGCIPQEDWLTAIP